MRLANRELTRYCCSPDLGYSHLAVHDPRGRFFCSTTLSENNFIKDLHDYAEGAHGRISFYDITAFHESDSDLAAEFLEIERRERNDKPSYPR